MRVFGTCLLIIGIGLLLIVGLLRIIRELLSRDVFAAHQAAGEDARSSRPDNIADMRNSDGARG
jgi:hypothetical protein